MSAELPGEFEVRGFTRDEFNRMVEAGFFTDGTRRIELIHGRLVVVPPEGPLHASLSTDLRARLTEAYADRAHVREAKPLACGAEEQPEPALVVVRGRPRDYDERHPRGDEAWLVIELSRTTHARDHMKAPVYAAAGVPVYWLLDVPNRRVELYSEPAGDRYGVVRIAGDGETLELPDNAGRLRVAALFDRGGAAR